MDWCEFGAPIRRVGSDEMATVAEKSADLAVPEWAPSQAVDEKIDRYLAARLKAVGADYRSVAITTFLLASAIGLVLWLAAGVVADHWLVPGGLGRTLRVAWLGVGAAVLLAAAIKWIVPLVLYRVNLVYAARSIERANPELRNDVVNTVLVRAHPERIPPVVVTSLEHRAAKRLSKLPADLVTDRGPALRLAVVLAMLVALACLYAVLSPKSLGVSLARLVAPLSNVAPPTRVRIGEPELGWRLPAVEGGGKDSFHPIAVKEGRATIVRNRQLVVRSRIDGMAAGEEPAVEASGIAENGSVERSSGWRNRMEAVAASGGVGGFEATLPGGGHGLSNDVVVSVTAGDARSEPVRIVVVDPPSLLVKQLKLVPPAYTRREPEILEWQGDVSGLEGTKVTLLAESKDPLEMAAIDFGCDGQGLAKMRIDPRDLARASGSFDLRLSADRSGPWERVYRLVFRPQGVSNDDGRERGIEHRINVVADTMPEVRVVEPTKPVVKVPPDKPVAVGVEAVDPDFALRSVAIELELERNGERMPRPSQPILEREFAGPFRGQAVFKPASVGGQAGDRLHYRAVAVDSKSPSPNAARTAWFTFDLDAAASPRPVPPGGHQESGRQGGGQNNASGGRESSSGGKERGAEGKSGGDEAKQGEGDRGSGPPEKGSEGTPSQGGGGSADGTTEPSQKASGSGGQNDSSGDVASDGKGGAGGKGGSEGSQGTESEGKGGGESSGGEATGQPGEGQKSVGRSDAQNQKQGAKQGGNDQSGGQGSPRQKNGEGVTSDDRANAGEGTADGKNTADSDGTAGRKGNERKGSEGKGSEGNGNGQRESSQKGDGERSQGGESNAEKSGAEKPVASDGTNDGEAIERILENRTAEKRGTNERGASDERGGSEGATTERGSEAESGQGEGKQGESRQGEANEREANQREAQQGEGQQGEGQQGEGQQGKSGGQKGDSSSEGGSSGGKDGPQKDGSKKPGAGESGAGQPADDGGETASQPGGEQGGSKTGETGKPGGATSRGDRDGKNGPEQSDGSQASQGKPSEDRDAGPKPGSGSNSQGNAGSPSQKDASQGSGSKESSSGKSAGGTPGDSDAGRAGEDLANDDAASDRKPSEQAGAGGRSGRGLGGATDGADLEKAAGQAASREAEWGEENLSHARNAVDLAVEHLKRSLAEGRSDVLDSLGWNREQARAFLDRWAQMAQAAKEGGPRKQRDFDRAVRSLGLTPGGVRRSRETVEQSRGNEAEGRRSQPPPEYREQFRAFSQGVRADGG